MGAGVESAGLHSARAPAVGVLPPMCVHTPLLPGRAGVKCYCVVAPPRGAAGARFGGGGGRGREKEGWRGAAGKHGRVNEPARWRGAAGRRLGGAAASA